ncbi:MAG: hypothetical protein JO013_06680 [Alphaproteobacteria bacterium]|nr:hypothetical protein [Alphaproteobacteria bacterium]
MRLDPRALACALGVIGAAAGLLAWWAIPERPKPCEELYSDGLRVDVDAIAANAAVPARREPATKAR